MLQFTDLRSLAYGYRDEAEKAIRNDHIDDAITLYRKSIQIFEQIDEPRDHTESLVKLGVLYALSGEKDLAIDHYLSALSIAIKNNYTFTQARIYNNIGNDLHLIHDYRGARELFRKGVQLMDRKESKQHPNYKRLLFVIYLNFVYCHIELHQFEEADKYVQLCWDLVNNSGFDDYYYAILIYELRLRWEEGNHDFVYQRIDEVIHHFTHDHKDQDFIQHVEQVCLICESMGDFDRWQAVIESFEKYAEVQDRSFFYMINADLWTAYYKTIGDSQSAQYMALEYRDYAKRYQRENEDKRAKEITSKLEMHILKTEQQEASLVNHIDPLTGVGDAKKLQKDYHSLLSEVCMSNGTLGLGIVDIDDFKKINEEKGYLEGDNILKSIATLLQNLTAEYGLVYHIGGDKFILLLAECNDVSLEMISSNIKKSLPYSVCQGYAYMFPNIDQDFDQFLHFAKRSLNFAKQQGPATTQITENSIKDYHLFYEQYRKNMEESAILETGFKVAQNHEEWLMNIMQRRIHNQELMKDNQRLIARYLSPILNGSELLTEESALSLAHEIWDMREAGYMENLVMLEVAKVVEKFLEQSQYPEEHIHMLIVLGEAYGHMNSDDYFDQSYFYYRKLNLYRGYLSQISKRSLRRTLYEAFLKGGTILAESKSTSFAKNLENIHFELDYFQDEKIKEALRLTTDEANQLLGAYVIHALSSPLLHAHKVDPENEYYIDAMSLVATLYRKALLSAETEFDIDDRLHFIYFRLRWLLGYISSEECYFIHKEYFNHIQEIIDCSELSNALETTLSFRMMVYYIPELIYMSRSIAISYAENEVDYINSLIETYMIYMSALPKGGRETGLTKELYHSLSSMLTYLPSWVNSYDLLYKVLIERNIEISIHSRMVSEICKLMVETIYRNQPTLLIGTFGFRDEDEVLQGHDELLTFMQNAGLIHDIGKIEINDIINQQIRRLTDLELENIRRHPEYGVKMVRNVDSMRKYIPIILGHHKYYNDREGYPEHYSYRENPEPLLVCIVQIADAIDAATDTINRNYANPKSLEAVYHEFEAQGSVRYHPALVEIVGKDPQFNKELKLLVTEGRDNICYEIYNSYSIFS